MDTIDTACTAGFLESRKKLTNDWDKIYTAWKEPWNLQTPAIKIVNKLHFIGNKEVSVHVLETAKGPVLIDTAFAQTSYLLTESLRSIGIDPVDIIYILHTHGHVDHCGATRRFIEMSQAKTALGEGDVEVVEKGTVKTCADYIYGIGEFETFTVDKALREGDILDFGDTLIHCHHSPGHTKGTMTFTFEVEDKGKIYTAGMFGGTSLWTQDNHHIASQGYPEGKADFRRTLEKLKKKNIELVLGNHPWLAKVFEKAVLLEQKSEVNPYISSNGNEWQECLKEYEEALDQLEDS